MNTSPAKASYILAASVFTAMLALVITDKLTEERIADAQKRLKSESLMAVLPTGSFDNAPLDRVHLVRAPMLSPNDPVQVFPVYKNGRPHAAALTIQTPDGYNGSIRLLLGFTANGTIIGSRVLQHQETPGLGDDIEIKRSDWMTAFSEQSLTSLTDSQWNVKPDGGAFDGFTGATITPRAVVRAIHRALIWFTENPNLVFIHEPN